MDLSIYKNAWAIYKKNFAKLFSFSLSYIIISVLAYVAIMLFSAFDYYLIGIAIISFLVIPLFYSYQIALLKVSSGLELDYSDFYANYKNYYKKSNMGIYSTLSSVLLTVLICFICIFLTTVLHDIIFPDLMEKAIAEIKMADDIAYYNEVIKVCINLDGFVPILIIFLSFGHVFFFVNMKKKVMMPYFSLVSPVPSIITKMINKKVYDNNKKDFAKYTSFGNLMFLLSFVIGFITCGLVSYIFIDYLQYIEYVLIIAFFGGMLFSSVLLSPMLITYCFIADSLHGAYLQELAKELIKLNNTLKKDGDPESEAQYKMIDDLIKSLNQTQNDEKENNSEEE